MQKFNLAHDKVHGKTYSLFGSSRSTDNYYDLISEIVDELLQHEPEIRKLIMNIREVTSIKSLLIPTAHKVINNKLVKYYYSNIKPAFSIYTKCTADHLKELSLYKRITDQRLGTTEEQYHYYMLEIELVNRLCKNEFNRCEYKIALLPHCLKDLRRKCKSEADEFDYICKGCSDRCYLHAISELLREKGILPYIWMKADIKKLFREYKKNGKRLGVIGIACIPEVESGIKKCMKAGIPVLGLPLNANRCGRWFGEFYPNSINLSQLKKLLR